MKQSFVVLLFFFLSVLHCAGQGPALSLVGGSPSFTKGTINTEVLSQVIQQKQEEVKKRVFKNLVVAQFNGTNYLNHLNNFTAYHYIYNLMDAITSGKNKTAVTKQILQNSAEFAYVYGWMFLLQSSDKLNKELSVKINGFDFAETIKNATVNTSLTIPQIAKKNDATDNGEQNKANISDQVKNFNLQVDMIYDLLLNDKSLHPNFEFTEDLTNGQFKTWYNSDNVFTRLYNNAPAADKILYDNLRNKYTARIRSLLGVLGDWQNMVATINSLAASSANDDVRKTVSDIKSVLATADLTGLNTLLTTLNGYTTGLVSDAQKLVLKKIQSTLILVKGEIIPLFQFYSQLQKSNFRDFSLTGDQFYALKFIVQNFLDLAKNQFKNDVVSSVIDFMLNNTLIEYQDNHTGMQVTEKNASNNDKGYLYVDIEALVSAIFKHFAATDKKGVYFQLFFTIGANQASFVNDNLLTVDKTGMATSLKSLYYASEKIGFEYKIWNWAYTHSFVSGESFSYYNNTGRYRTWLRPQQQPLISDFHLMVYGSGLLYNLVNLKSNDQFNYGIAGVGAGVAFFNGLKFNVSIAKPFTNGAWKRENEFINVGIDVPILDYIAGLSKNK